MAKTLDQRGYLTCPACGSHETEGKEVEVLLGAAEQDMTCRDCGAEWRTIYRFERFLIYKREEETEAAEHVD